VNRVRLAAANRLTRWAARRHGRDTLPHTIGRRRIYIVPTRFGMALGLLLAAMLIAGLNYNSNLGLAFGFLMTSLTLVAMHLCHRNLLGLRVDVVPEADAFAGGRAEFEFVFFNDSAIERCDIEIHCAAAAGGSVTYNVAAHGYCRAIAALPTVRRGVVRQDQFEVRTRYPFGWFRAWTYVHSPLIAFVAPAAVGDRGLPASSAAKGSTAYSEARGDEDFAGLRAYEAGVPLKHMAWKVLARGGEPAVRSYSGGAAQPEWLDWSLLDGLDAEARLSQLCRWVLTSDAAQMAYGLRIPGTEVAAAHGAAHRLACLRALAAFGEQARP
jgi:uncharacterized protein (DUF58 family)